MKESILSKKNTAAHDPQMAIKQQKYAIFQKTSDCFLANLRILIQYEGTQKKLAQRIGVSEELLSKYKSGDAFPAIETLILLAQCYQTDLDTLLMANIGATQLFKQANSINTATFTGQNSIFQDQYYMYFYVTNMDHSGLIHQGVLNFSEANRARFEIHSDRGILKTFEGQWHLGQDSKMVYLHLEGLHSDRSQATIHLIRPALSQNTYVGGMGLMLLPADASSKPCAQRVLISRTPICRDTYCNELEGLLNFDGLGDQACPENLRFEKIGHSQDEQAYLFIRKIERQI